MLSKTPKIIMKVRQIQPYEIPTTTIPESGCALRSHIPMAEHGEVGSGGEGTPEYPARARGRLGLGARWRAGGSRDQNAQLRPSVS
jgi:hypothetical protein